jgi:hypothetical protein
MESGSYCMHYDCSVALEVFTFLMGAREDKLIDNSSHGESCSLSFPTLALARQELDGLLIPTVSP